MQVKRVCKNVKSTITDKAHMQRIYKLGVFLRLLRSTVFNLLVFFIGFSAGMGFTMLNAQQMWKERYDSDTLLKLERVLQKHNVENTEISHILLELRDKRLGINVTTECSNANNKKR